MYICLGKILRKMPAIHMSVCSIVWTFTSERQWGKESIPHHFCKMKPNQTAQKQQPINDLTVECLSDRSISFWGNRKYRSFGNNESVSFLPVHSLCANDHHPLPFCSSLHSSVRLQNHMDDAFQAHEPLFARALTTLILSAYFYAYKKKWGTIKRNVLPLQTADEHKDEENERHREKRKIRNQHLKLKFVIKSLFLHSVLHFDIVVVFCEFSLFLLLIFILHDISDFPFDIHKKKYHHRRLSHHRFHSHPFSISLAKCIRFRIDFVSLHFSEYVKRNFCL